jgi:RNA polymerase sigma-70 factor (ECF subfamily)
MSTHAEDAEFQDLIRRVRSGDEQAASQLVKQYESAIRRAVRYRLGDSRLRRTFDSLDMCQAVLGSFFIRAASGDYELDSPEQLLRLLESMARKKLAQAIRGQRAARRDHRRLAAEPIEQCEAVGSDPTPSAQLAANELLREVRARLSPDELRLVELRNEGRDWADIAAQLGGNPAKLRKQLSRALARVASELGLEEESSDEDPGP